MKTKIMKVVELLQQGKGTKEITAEVQCSEGTVSKARQRIEDMEYDASDDDITETLTANGFIRKVAMEPDPELDTSKEPVVEETEYGCSCGARWTAPKNERQTECPECGMEFQ